MSEHKPNLHIFSAKWPKQSSFPSVLIMRVVIVWASKGLEVKAAYRISTKTDWEIYVKKYIIFYFPTYLWPWMKIKVIQTGLKLYTLVVSFITTSLIEIGV